MSNFIGLKDLQEKTWCREIGKQKWKEAWENMTNDNDKNHCPHELIIMWGN